MFADSVFCTDPASGDDTKFDFPTRKNGADKVCIRLCVGAQVLHLRVFFSSLLSSTSLRDLTSIQMLNKIKMLSEE